ncbi:hypothetical protein U1Q18_028202 [Sarracenia purpurea var. burkii]
MSKQGEGRIEQGWNARTSIKGIGVAGDVRGVSTSSLSQRADRERFANGEEGSVHGDEVFVFGRDRRTNAREGARDSGKRVASNYQLPKPNLTFAQAVVSGIGEDDAVRARRKSHELGISKIVSSGLIDGVRQVKRAWLQSNTGSEKGQDAASLGQDNLVVEAREVNEAWLKSCVVGILNEAIKVESIQSAMESEVTKPVSAGPCPGFSSCCCCFLCGVGSLRVGFGCCGGAGWVRGVVGGGCCVGWCEVSGGSVVRGWVVGGCCFGGVGWGAGVGLLWCGVFGAGWCVGSGGLGGVWLWPFPRLGLCAAIVSGLLSSHVSCPKMLCASYEIAQSWLYAWWVAVKSLCCLLALLPRLAYGQNLLDDCQVI